MTEGLACIALAAAHLEAEQKRRNQESPFIFSQNSRSGVVPLSSLPRPLSNDARAISYAPFSFSQHSRSGVVPSSLLPRSLAKDAQAISCAPFNFSQNLRSGVVHLSTLPRPLSKDAQAISCAPFNVCQNSRSGVVPLSSLPRPLSNDARAISNAIAEASDEDPFTDAEETLALILAAQPKDIPPPPAPDEPITILRADDVLCGRGRHARGNVQYRGLVKKYQALYLKAKPRDKPKIARIIVNSVRCLNGRFLRKESDGVWKDVGNVKAREKTSQALRERAPEIRGYQGKRRRKVLD